MPSHLIHCKLSRELFGKSYYMLHRAIDSGYIFKGGKHRNYFLHDSFSAMIIAQNLYPNDEKAVAAAQFHLELDELCSSNPVLHDYLEKWAKLKVKKKRKSKKRKEVASLPPEFRHFLKDLKTMSEICRLAERLS